MEVKIFLAFTFALVSMALCSETMKMEIIDRPKDCPRLFLQ